MPNIQKEVSPQNAICAILDARNLTCTEAEQALEAIGKFGSIQKIFTTGGLSQNPKLEALIERFPVPCARSLYAEEEFFSDDINLEISSAATQYENEGMSVAIVSGEGALRKVVGDLKSRGVKTIVAAPPEFATTYRSVAHVFISLDRILNPRPEVERELVKVVRGLSKGLSVGRWLELSVVAEAIRVEMEPDQVKEIGRLGKFLLRCRVVEVEKSDKVSRCRLIAKRTK